MERSISSNSRFSIFLLSISFMISFVVAVSLDPYDAYGDDGFGDYSATPTDPDTIDAWSIADGITTSAGWGWVSSETDDITTTGSDHVYGRCDYYLKTQLTKEYGDDTAIVLVMVQLWKDDAKYFPTNATYQSDFTGTVEHPTYPFMPGSGTYTYQVKVHPKSITKGEHTGSYSDADFGRGSLEFDVTTFYVIVY